MSVDGQVTSRHRISPGLWLRVWGRSGLVLDPDYISGSSGTMSLYSGLWIGLLRYQPTHLQVDSGNVRYRQALYSHPSRLFPSVVTTRLFMDLMP